MAGDWLVVTSVTQTPGPLRRPIDQWRDQGGHVLQVVHDLLPIRVPGFFPGAQEWFSEWLRVVTTRADLLVCDSEATADDLRSWLVENPPDRPDAPMVTHMRLGYDLIRSVPYPQTLRLAVADAAESCASARSSPARGSSQSLMLPSPCGLGARTSSSSSSVVRGGQARS